MKDGKTRRPASRRKTSSDWLIGGGEMGRRIRARDWGETPLGPVDGWPQSLRSAVSILLPSKAQICLFWGPELIKLYNDAYIPVLAEKHPAALGAPAREVWSEIWSVLGPLLDGVVTTGEAFRATDHPFYLKRRGFIEETFFDVSYDPIRDESGGVGGVFCIVGETTGRVLGERRLRTLRDLGRANEARSPEEACRLALGAAAGNRQDLPFVALYLVSAPDGLARRVDVVGAPTSGALTPAAIEVRDPRWPLASVEQTGRPTVWEPPAGEPPPPASRLVVHPILRGGQSVGFVLTGVSPFLALEGDYADFLDLVAAHIATAVNQASSYDEERKRAEALAELDRAKTTFFSNISHEFRTPLTLMLGPMEDRLRADTLDPADRDALEVAHRNGLRLLRLVNTLLDFSRIEAGRTQVQYVPCDLGVLTAELASVFRSAMERVGLRLEIRCPRLSEPVFVDPEMWEKIVLNLLSNAFKFTFEGTVTVELGDLGTTVELTVRDTGTGIPAADLPHVFERFHRVDGARGRTFEGSGIGLALVLELVRLHGGTVRVESEEGRGSAFFVGIPKGQAHLPAGRIGPARPTAAAADVAAPFVEEAMRWLPDAGPRAAARDDAPARVPDQPPASRAWILLADDNADMREYVARLLRARWDVETAADGLAALEAARRRPPDLVLTDAMMPRLDGFGLLRALRAEVATRDVPVILLSARAGEESRVEGLDAGADDYVTKPFSARELVARVEAHLGLSRQRTELLARERDARREAESASRAKDEFLAVLSHELRTPLNAVYGWARMLRSGEIRGEAQVRALDVIMRNANAQVQLIDDLLDVSRIVTGKMRLDVQPVDLRAVIEGALDTVRPAAEARGLRLACVLDPDAVALSGDPHRLQQVVWNLLMNAVKFTPKGGQVQVELRRVVSSVEIVVSDTGQGIRADMLSYVFERFRQADSSSTRTHAGLGLGLALVRHLVELHGGTVTAESPGEGLGSTFTVTLPIAIAQSERSRSGPGDAPGPGTGARIGGVSNVSLSGLRVLVVDDDRDGLDLVTAILIGGGADVRGATSAAEALAILQAWGPDVLISDIEMPGEDGYTLIRKVRALDAAAGGRTPAVALTAYGRMEDRLRSLSAGYSMHVPKPVDPTELSIVVASLAGR